MILLQLFHLFSGDLNFTPNIFVPSVWDTNNKNMCAKLVQSHWNRYIHITEYRYHIHNYS